MANNIDSMTNQYMQISGRSTQTRGPERSGDNPAQADTARAAGSGQNVDTIELTGDARLMQAVEQRISAVSEVDTARVEEVRGRIASGNYSVSAERTADKMLAMEQSMPGDS